MDTGNLYQIGREINYRLPPCQEVELFIFWRGDGERGSGSIETAGAPTLSAASGGRGDVPGLKCGAPLRHRREGRIPD